MPMRKALAKILCCRTTRQLSPEGIRDPKQVCADLRDGSNQSTKLAEMYTALAKVIDLGLLESRCPNGFGVFAQQIRNL
jgi:hypothetical protein